MKKLLKTVSLVMTAAILAGCSAGGNAADANSPLKGKNVTFICPWSAGGSSDAMTRKVAEMFAKETGSNTSVENQEGAGGTTATTDFKQAATDGTSICLEAVGVFTLQPLTREVNYSIDDFTPIVSLTTEPIVMLASKASGIQSVEDLAARETASYGFNGAGSLIELCQKKFFGMTEVEATGVSYDGSSEVLAALLGGHIDIGVAHPADCLQYIESGDLVPLGIFSAERDSRDALKDIPTFKEQGYDCDFSVWKFMIVPKETSAEMTEYLTSAMDKIVVSDEFKEFCESYTLLPTKQTADEMKARIAEELEVNAELLNETK